MDSNLLYLIALSRALPLNPSTLNLVIDAAGNAQQVFEHRTEIADLCPTLSEKNALSIAQMDQHLERAEEELKFIERHHIQCLTPDDEAYPQRLCDLGDAPALLFSLGTASLNATHILSIVGSRRCTEYGKIFCHHFLEELSQLCPDTLIVSGLAYGADICAHREALRNGLATVGVLAHGLDQIYPRQHSQTAREMVLHGGLVTEYQSGANADKVNFVNRNRIVAAISDATLVLESKEHGGSLITTRLAGEMGRKVWALPGRTTDEMSRGCNQLIADGRAQAMLSASQFVKEMGWKTIAMQQQPVQREMFPELSEQDQQLLNLLKQAPDGLTLNQLTQTTGMNISALTAHMFELEMQGVVKMVRGNRYLPI